MIWKQFTHLEHFPPELETGFNSFLTTEFDDSLSVEMQFRSIIKWCQDNFKTVDTLVDFINDISKWLTEFEVRFGERLEEQVINVLEEWQQSGYINVVISEAIQWELDDFKVETESNFERLVYKMPLPQSRLLNTSTLQSLLDKAKDGLNIRILFEKGIYELDTCFISSNTEIILDNNTILTTKGTLGSPHLFRNIRSTEGSFTGYNGHGNIVIRGGTVKNSHLISLIHGENIRISNMKIIDTDANHIVEIAGCKNVIIEDCIFSGMKYYAGNYVEYIQLDPCKYESFPWLPEGSPCFDDTPNRNIYIRNNEFSPSETTGYENLYCAFGGHTPSLINHENINFTGNIVYNASYTGVKLITSENITIKNNVFNKGSKGIILQVYDIAENVEIKNVTITNNVFRELSAQGIQVLAHRTTTNLYMLSLFIESNFFDRNTSDNITIDGVSGAIVSKNQVDGGTRLGIIVRSNNIIVTENKVQSLTTQLINFTDCTGVMFNSNTLSDSSVVGSNIIYVNSCANYLILENSFNNIGGSGYSLVRTTDSGEYKPNLKGGFVDGNRLDNVNNTGGLVTEVGGVSLPERLYGQPKKLLFSGSANGNTNIILSDNITKYDEMIVATGSISEGTYSVGTAMSYYDTNFRLGENYTVDTIGGSTTFTITDDNTLTISNFHTSVRAIYAIKNKLI